MKTERASNPQQESLNIPLKVKHIFLTFMQEFCSMQNPEALLHWNAKEPEKSNTWILDSYAHDIEKKVEQKPLIVFKRGPIYTAQTSMYQNLARMENRNVDPTQPNSLQEIEYRTYMVSGNAEWNCISRQGLEAESIASVVAMVHQAHQQVLMQKGLFAVKSVQIGEEVMISGDVETEMVMVPVSISYDMQVHYEYWESGEVLKHANIYGRGPDGDLLLNTDP
jgi:hypothetical protein